jgi:DNA-binding CsgD family transcriptional regulator
VDPRAFGGFRVGWEAFHRLGLELFDIVEELRFLGFPQDRIVKAVLDGEADMGIVRSGLLERMIAEGQLAEGALRVLNSNVTYTHAEAVSTRLYPEWPFLALPGTTREARDAVALALLSAARDAPDLPELWSAPVNYHAAQELEATFEAARAAAAVAGSTGSGRAGLFLTMAASAGGILLLLAWIWRAGGLRRAPSAPLSAPDGPAETAEAIPLTRRERQVLDGIAQGLSTKEIAQALGISPKTVEFHRSNLLRKFDARSAAQLVGLAQIRET